MSGTWTRWVDDLFLFVFSMVLTCGIFVLKTLKKLRGGAR